MKNERESKNRPVIGLLADHLIDEYSLNIFLSINETVKKENIDLFCFLGSAIDSPYEYNKQKNVIYDQVHPRLLDGLIVISSAIGNFVDKWRMQEFLKQYSAIPRVSVGMTIPGIPSVVVDNSMGIYDLVEHFIKIHKSTKIAFIRGPEGNPEAEMRFTAYKHALEENGIKYDPALVAQGNFIESGKDTLALLLDERKVMPDAIIGANDHMAVDIVRALHGRGIAVPDDIKVAGFDGAEESRYLTPPLSTVQQPYEKMGKTAVEFLVRQIKGEAIPQYAVLPARMIIRRSCGCREGILKPSRHKSGMDKSPDSITEMLNDFREMTGKIELKSNEYYNELYPDLCVLFDIPGMLHKWIDLVIDDYLANSINKSVLFLEDVLNTTLTRGVNPGLWVDIFTEIFERIADQPSTAKANFFWDNLWTYTRLLFNAIAERDSHYTKIAADLKSQEFIRLHHGLATALNLDDLQLVVEKEMPANGINSCYISLYTDTHKRPFIESRLVCHFSQDQNLQLEHHDFHRPFPSYRLIPAEFRKAGNRFTYLVMPLSFKRKHLGFVLFEYGNGTDGSRSRAAINNLLFETLALQLSTAIEASTLVNKVKKYAGRLEDAVKVRTKRLHDEIDEKNRTENELYQEKEQAIITLESIGDGVVTTDTDGNIKYLNPVAETMSGFKKEAVLGCHFDSVFYIFDERTGKTLKNLVRVALHKKESIKLTDHFMLVSDEGRNFFVHVTITPIFDREHDITGTVFVIRNMSETHKMSIELDYQASHDVLTGLYNRAKFEMVIKDILQDNTSPTTSHSFCFVDVNNLRMVNSLCGTQGGDELLRKISRILKDGIRVSDQVARVGGDQFAILLTACPIDKAKKIARNLQEKISEQTFHFSGKEFKISFSIGIVSINPGQKNIAEIFSAADMACYIAKNRGGNRIHIHNEDDEDHIRYASDINSLPNIMKAIDEDRFCLYSQKIQNIGLEGAQQGTHYEILIRMLDEKGGLIAPSEFIPPAERYNIMPKIDRWVISKLFSSNIIPKTVNGKLDDSKYCINLSGTTLNDETFLDFVMDQMHVNNILPHSICFEITETTAITNFSRAIYFIKKLNKSGCCFSLDDFGSGWSSFSYLKLLPMDYLKIDGSFVRGIVENPLDFVFVQTINHIGHVMGCQTVAEYVENTDILFKLREIGVNYAQGFGIEIPKPLDI
ncbi:MAG: EAL domain-containing protein [Spirochaetales bacterium]|nr:EAL domain-containing protein [Spirochaetales bacterium]